MRAKIALVVSCVLLAFGASAAVPPVHRLIFGATPNMGLTLPSPGVTPGPTWATQLVTALTTIDAHDHTPGKGVAIPTAAYNPTDNLNLGGFNLTGTPEIDWSDGVTKLTSNGTDLYYTDGSSNSVRLTASGSLNAALVRGVNGAGYAAPVAINWDNTNLEYTFDRAVGSRAGGAFSKIRFPSFTTKSANYTVAASDQFGMLIATANSFTVTLPVAGTAANIGRVLTVKCAAAAGTVTVARQGSDTIDTSSTSVTVACLANGGSAITFWSDGTSKWYQIGKF